MEINNENIFILGDHHGNYFNLARQIKESNLQGSALIHVGDGGEGFPNFKTENDFNRLNALFKELDCVYYSIRGNHSNPLYFKGDSRIDLSNFKLLEDYTVAKVNGEKWQFVGGAISVDRCRRTLDWDYWTDEAFILDLDKAVNCDVLVTHTTPTWNGPTGKDKIEWYCNQDALLWDELVKERNDIDALINACFPHKHFCGHMHNYSYMDLGEIESRIIEMDGIYQYQK
jgi:hypothetical protein